MSFTDRKLEITMFALVAVMIGGLGYALKSPAQAALATADVSYEMPRPKSFLAALFGFDLGDREINRKYVNPFDKKKEDVKKAAAKAAATPAAPKAVAQKKAEAKKTSEVAKKSKVDVNVVAGNTKPALAGSDIAAGGHGGGAGNLEAGNGKNAAMSDTKKDDKSGMSADQWRALVSGQPTKENVDKLISAYFTKEVDDATFYTIVNDLLHNNKSETQALGLYAASATYSSQSFAVVASNYGQLSAENQTKAQTYLMGYASSGRSGALLGALKSTSAEVVELAAQVIIKGYQQATANTVAADPRTARGDTAKTSNAVSDYSKFIPVFQQLAQSSDATIVGLANSALSQIHTGVAAN